MAQQDVAYLARLYPPAVDTRIALRFRTFRNEADTILSAEQLAQAAVGCTHLFVSATERVRRCVFEALADTLKAVATLSVGHDHIDLEEARARGVAVFNTPDVLTDACAEVAMALVLNATRRCLEGDRMVRSGRWPGWAPTQLLGLGLVGRRLGILGMGRIGQALALRASAFGMEIHYHNRRPLPPDLARGAIHHRTPEDLLAVSDVFSINASATPELVGFLDRKRIALLPDQAVVINISRGDMIDDDALIEALGSGRLFAAGLDVFRNEPAIDPRYAALPNVFLTPHVGSATLETRNAMGFMLLQGIATEEAGGRAANRLV